MRDDHTHDNIFINTHDDVYNDTHHHTHHDTPPHTPPHTHSHTHPHTQTKAVLNRLSRMIGHLEAIRRMVEDGRDCSEVLTQLAAVKAALNSTGRVIVKDHLDHCIVAAIERRDHTALEELNKAIEQFMK